VKGVFVACCAGGRAGGLAGAGALPQQAHCVLLGARLFMAGATPHVQ
jgi:hypothetical protein